MDKILLGKCIFVQDRCQDFKQNPRKRWTVPVVPGEAVFEDTNMKYRCDLYF